MIEATIEAIDLDIAALIDAELSPKASAASLAAFARETLSEAEALNIEALGFKPEHTTTVDGIVGLSEDAVRPGGQIDYAFALLSDVFAWIMEQLRAHSPIGEGSDAHPGLYKSSHVLFADGVQVDPEGAIPPASKYIFFNTTPYARPIERSESRQAPSGVYEAIAVLSQQRFGNQAAISFSFIAPDAGGIVNWAHTPLVRDLARRRRGGRAILHQEWLTRVPAITVTLR